MPRLDEHLVARLFQQAKAARWDVSLADFTAALERSVEKASEGRAGSFDAARYAATLHLEDLALACACAAGHERAWEHFIREHRPTLYRGADAIDRSGGARELADSLYAELYGLKGRDGTRTSLFRYFHARSSLATWLRAILAQRHVDQLRAGRRVEAIPEEDSPRTLAAPAETPNPDRPRFAAIMQRALSDALARVAAPDRLRLRCYYAEAMTLAQIARLFGEHEATASRNLTRARRTIRDDVERQLRTVHGMSESEVEECFTSILDDAGTFDLGEMLPPAAERKKASVSRSTTEGMP